MIIDQGNPVILVLLSLYAAFDAVDQNFIFSMFKDIFGLSGKVLSFPESVCLWYFI